MKNNNTIIIFTRPWFNEFFLKVAARTPVLKDCRQIVVTEFIADAQKPDWHLLWPLKEDISQIPADLNTCQIIKKDRLLRNIDEKTALKMIANCYKQLNDIVSRQKPRFALMPSVDNYTLDIFSQICKNYGVFVLGFSGFFDTRFRFAQCGEANFLKNDPASNMDFIGYFKNRGKSQAIKNKINARMTLGKRFIENFVLTRASLVKKRFFTQKKDYENGNFFIHCWYHGYTSMPRFFIDDLFAKNYFCPDLEGLKNDKPLIYISLHVIPEASIDYWGSLDRMDHDSIVLELIEKYGANYQFIVKEHPAMFGCRPLGFYGRIKAGGAILLDPYFDNYAAIERSDAVITWSGSAGLESIFLNRRCLNIIKPFYNLKGFTTYPQSRQELFSNFSGLINRLNTPDSSAIAATNQLLNNISAPGNFGSQDLSDANIQKIAKACQLFVAASPD